MHDTIIEPFAGSAGYSVRYANRKIILIDKDPYIAGTWRYLISASMSDILALPDLEEDQTVDDLDICQEARWLIGWWLNSGSSQPKKRVSAWMRNQESRGGPGWKTKGQLSWGVKVRERIAANLGAIRHWIVIEGDWRSAPDIRATWFIDPPYEVAGKYYRYKNINYSDLSNWCRSRRGQVLVCENVGASWLPFIPWIDIQANASTGSARVSKEALYIQQNSLSARAQNWISRFTR